MNASSSFHQTIKTEKDMMHFAASLAVLLAGGMTVFLHGPLGAGKTTFVRGVLSGRGHSGKVKSPTYAIVEPYQLSPYTVFHFDFYRINGPDELFAMGIAEYFTPHTICFIEWPEKGLSLLPMPDLTCYIAMIAEGRELRIEAHTSRGEEVLAALSGTMG